MHCLQESRPHGFILTSAGTFHCKACPSPSDENIWGPYLKQCVEQTREKERKEMGGKEKKELLKREECILEEELLDSPIIECSSCARNFSNVSLQECYIVGI